MCRRSPVDEGDPDLAIAPCEDEGLVTSIDELGVGMAGGG